MRYRRVQVHLWTRGSCCLTRHRLHARIPQFRTYSTQHEPRPPPPTERKRGAELVKEHALSLLQHAGEMGRLWADKSIQAVSATVMYWWDRYEEFVGLNEVREAQTKVNEAEAAFMVARGIVWEAQTSLEAVQTRLKDIRDRLDRVSREEARYLELATLEHKLLQEERRLRAAYETAESSERENFALFSAAVRGSHEKERTRAERTKNWSIIGSVLGALIGVMGSTYINRVRLQELKNLLLEAQKGPESLQEALKVQAGNHRSQQEELRTLIDSLRQAVTETFTQRSTVPPEAGGQAAASPIMSLLALKDLQAGSQRAEALLETLPSQFVQLERDLDRVESELVTVRRLLEAHPPAETQRGRPLFEKPEQWESQTLVRGLQDTQRTLGERIKSNTVYNAVFTYTASAITVAAVYLLLRGAG